MPVLNAEMKKNATPQRKHGKRPTSRPVQIRMATHIIEQLDELAAERGTDRTALIQSAVADLLERHNKLGKP